MYIYGGIGPSGQDSTMYKLDLTKWEWSTSSLNGDKEDSKNKSRSITAVLIAAIISSVFGVLTIGIAATVIYRWSRRRQIAARLFNRGGGQGNDSDSDSDSEYINDNDIARDSREKGDGTQLKGNESMIATSAKEADYPSHTQSSHIGAAFDNDSASSYADKTTPQDPYRSGSTIIDQQSATNMYGSDHHRLENEYRHAELINQILLSEQPIPAWLLDAVNQAEANNQSEQRTPASNDEDESDEQSQPRQPSKSLKVANRS
ncbi:hypothetical protein GGI12_000217 [Dipsacomyces acuminosporus]|nr:hypothetical protein GGI12_000217 [Dipsacomyces acuminosporus]